MIARILVIPLLAAALASGALALSSCPPILSNSNPQPRSMLAGVEFVGTGPRQEVTSENDTLLNDDLVEETTNTTGTDKIVGGTLSTGDLNNYVVQLFYNGGFLCTGSVLNRKYVVSAAHCRPPSASGVVVWFWTASSGDWLTARRVRRVISHPQYNDFTLENDIMLLQLRGRAPSSASAITVNNRKRLPRNNAITRVAGFGVTREGGSSNLALRQVDVPARSKGSCQRLDSTYNHNLHLCAGYKCGGCDSCQGDSGGPIFQFDSNGYVYQVGIVSYGVGCARPSYPGVYTRMSKYRRWIKRKIKNTPMYVGGRVPQVKVSPNACP